MPLALAHPRALACALACALLVAASCQPATENGGKPQTPDALDVESTSKRKIPPPRPIAEERIIRALEAEVAELKRQKATGQTSPSAYPGAINSHEHLYKSRDLERYLPAARAAGIASTVIVASPIFTLESKGEKGEPSMSENFVTVLAAAKEFPGEIIPFCTLDPKDPDKLDRLKKHVAAGAIGVKIYTGHSNFYDGPLNPPDMDPVFQYMEEIRLPINWHINLAKFMPEFEEVMKKYPNLNVMVPHYGVAFWKPDGPALARLSALMRSNKNLMVDTSLGTREILLNGMAAIEPAREKFQAFFKEFQDQIVWGTDSVITGNPEKTPAWYSKVIWATRDHLDKDVFSTELAAGYSKYYVKGRDGEGRYQGLNLSPEIMQKVYVANPRKWLKLK
ncbi:MAG: amidohydrolase family protein [Deltaproteobacteria bacterium]|nr:amidohydrolase family protein [Deltaproteobacteria bacterium]